MMARWQVQVAVGLVVIVFAVGIVVNGDTPNPTLLRLYSVAVTVVLFAFGAWDRWLWRLGPIQRWMKAAPQNLNGTWSGTLISEWIDPSTGEKPPTKPAYLVVRQSFSKVEVTMLTDEMTSRSALAKVTRADGASRLDYMYMSEPDAAIQDRSRIHHGSTTLTIEGLPPARLRGHYWTSRDSRGSLDFTTHRKTHADSADRAESLFRESVSSGA